MEQSFTQQDLKLIWNGHVMADQTSLVQSLMAEGARYFHPNFVERKVDGILVRCTIEEARRVEEWLLVTFELANDLMSRGEWVLSNEYGSWWGRTTMGKKC